MAKKHSEKSGVFCPPSFPATKFSDGFLQKTVEVWQPYSKTALTLEDAREISVNMVSLYSYLLELDAKYRACDKE